MDKVTPIGTDKAPVRRNRKRHEVAETRHQDRSGEWELAKKAYELRTQGKSLYEIAELLELSHPNYVTDLLAERYDYDAAFMTDSERTSVLAMELVRLDKLQDAAWLEAMTGEPRAIDSVLKVMAHRAKILGLEKTDPVVQKNLVLVMGEKEADYIEALKRVSDD